MPAIKRERSASPDTTTVPEESVGIHHAVSDASHVDRMRQLPPAISSSARPCIVANQAHLAPDPYVGSSPRKYRLDVLGRRTDQAKLSTPLLSRFPSRLASAMATAAGNATTVTKTITLANERAITPQNSKIINMSDHESQHENDDATIKSSTMDEHLGSPDASTGDVAFGNFPPMNMRENDEGIFVSRTDLEELQYGVQLLRTEHAASQEKVQNQGVLITELITFGQTMHQMIEHLNQRIQTIESANLAGFNPSALFTTPAPAVQPITRSRPDGVDRRSRSPSPECDGYRDRSDKPQKKKKKGRKDLEISIPGNVPMPAATSGILPTPLSQSMSASAHAPKTPITPGRTGPPPSAKRISTCVNKRNIHNLDQMVPPTYAHIPLLPLTDTEIIVYMFNSLCRPIVSLRLYARGWGPAAISDVVNTHRVVQPAYLRNTCSVKCTTAIKKGVELYGEQWSVTNREIFQDNATLDDKATDMIRLAPDEQHMGVDYEIRALCNGLKKHPDESEGSIFTRCVKYCEQTNAPYTLADVFELASDLEAGRTPRRCQTPVQQCKTEDSPSSTQSD